MRAKYNCSFIIFSLLLVLNSCAGIQHIYKGSSIPLTSSTAHKLSGVYEDIAYGDTLYNYENNCWVQLIDNGYPTSKDTEKRMYIKYTSPYTIGINVISSQELEIALQGKGQEILKTYRLRGKIRKGCFCAKRTKMIPFFPIYGFVNSTSMRIGLMDKGIFIDGKSRHPQCLYFLAEGMKAAIRLFIYVLILRLFINLPNNYYQVNCVSAIKESAPQKRG